MSVEAVLQALVAGLLIGSLYGLMCIGLALIFGIMRVINFAQGEFLMLGMYAALFIAPVLAGTGAGGAVAGALAATLLAAPVLFAAGWLIHAAVLGPATRIRTRSGEAKAQQAQFIVTLGVSLALQNGAMLAFGSGVRTLRTPLAASAWSFRVPFTEDAEIFVNRARLVSCVIGIALAAGLHLLISRTWIGRALRATADNPVAAGYMGIDVGRVHRFAFALGTAVTAAAGALVALQYPFQPFIGLDFVIVMYAGVVLGGMGSIGGAFWGGLAIGLVQQAATLVLPNQLQNVALFAIFLLILFARPQGFFGRSAERT